ncbi:MAG: class I SAM-dependent methyltransferase [Candidatus Aminicenantales bacterium]
MRPVVVEAFARALSVILDPSHKQDYIPWFWDYHGSLVRKEKLLKIVRAFDDNFNLARIEPAGKIILDAGCGFGIPSLLISLMGAQEVHGIEIFQPMVNTFAKFLTFLPSVKGIYPKWGDVVKTGYPGNSFDFVLSNEALSHYYDIPGFLQEAWRVLKPGGILFISDGNNGANPWRVWSTHRVWDRFENGPSGPIYHHKVEMPYRELRANIVQEEFPDFTADEVIALIAGTFGYTKAQVLEAARVYQESHTLPKSYYRYGQACPVHPMIAQYIERLIYPCELDHQLREVGFRYRIYAHAGGAGGNSAVRAVNAIVQALSPLTWPVGRGLRVVAQKGGAAGSGNT